MAVKALSDLVLINITEGHHLGVNTGRQVRWWSWVYGKDMTGLRESGEWPRDEEDRVLPCTGWLLSGCGITYAPACLRSKW